ncbi:MAG: hypothetical protein K8T20_16575 [Planctomycetes bacterium]|nr:hypothetical protein [Planctomycetota bacterium]
MTVPRERSSARTVAFRVLVALPIVLGFAPAAFFGVRWLIANAAKQQRWEDELKQNHPGHFAWFVGKSAYVLEMSSLGGDDSEPNEFIFDGEVRRVLWSSDGKTLYVVVATGRINEVDRIESVDLASRNRRTILDLGTQKLEDDDLDPKETWVAPWGDAESENDRIYFRLGNGKDWYSVEGKRTRVRPEPGRPAKPWDQSKCPDGMHLLKQADGDKDHWLELTDGHRSVKVTRNNVTEPGAWWCAPR